ncbi:Putative 2-aminoethylphosphonate transport system permease protein PhnV [Marinomonas spartinae]|uniref:Putative 2-aminoethylphosphonate transport system permease protein PhnV n=1 Tax=Marinomonas spartinae TaxID=1792290 RepID=A0A1A8T137_9GAMM|nr:ABC transporter permease [Marinomonas spartinae]MBJ7553995.1 ABC transporter permease [Marinomonas spartinae]SBS24707.1 Putative 2-aminoethylphosphonate transport system permease protein PhnV [Marinomonas spartinae]SBS25321.1 Putative 2-aminoethylphosphonate transport system permease protein PhnV [Marinomonas spartinae]
MSTKRAMAYHYSVTCFIYFLLLIPLLATLVYSLCDQWGATILPSGFTFKWYIQLWTDPRFLTALYHSMTLAVGTLILSAVLIVPCVFVVFYYYPKLDTGLNILTLLPFAIPPVVSSVGLLQLYSDYPLLLTGTPWILVGCYVGIALPFIYRAVNNNLRALNVHDLMDAARLLGASSTQAFFKLILPNIRKGLMASLFLSFSFLIGEFVFANLLAGANFETLQVYLYNMQQNSSHFTSALVISYFSITLILTLLATRFNR